MSPMEQTPILFQIEIIHGILSDMWYTRDQNIVFGRINAGGDQCQIAKIQTRFSKDRVVTAE